MQMTELVSRERAYLNCTYLHNKKCYNFRCGYTELFSPDVVKFLQLPVVSFTEIKIDDNIP